MMSQEGFLLSSREFVKGFRCFGFFFLKILFHCSLLTLTGAVYLGLGFHGLLN
jgi:hypothetical protein